MMTPQEAAAYIARIKERFRDKTAKGSIKKEDAAFSYEELVAFILGITNPDVLLFIEGITVNGNTVDFLPLVKWRINNTEYQKSTLSSFNVPFTSAGFKRTDIVVADNNNQLTKIQGTPSSNISIAPTIPSGKILVSYIYVFEDTIQQPTPDYSNFLTKNEFYEILSGLAINKPNGKVILWDMLRDDGDENGKRTYFIAPSNWSGWNPIMAKDNMPFFRYPEDYIVYDNGDFEIIPNADGGNIDGIYEGSRIYVLDFEPLGDLPPVPELVDYQWNWPDEL